VIRQTSIKLGKTAVLVKDSPGFISNRVLCPMINEAIFALEEGIATREDIDTVMKLGMNHPMGPLELADFVGLDVVLDVLTVLYNEFQDSKYRASPLLRRMVRAGYLGRKTKKGFYTYD
ncbi:MAG: 3-hydroxyacyl-CoA dehydrogenase family protein, partial [Nitrososphaerales archaeon]